MPWHLVDVRRLLKHGAWLAGRQGAVVVDDLHGDAIMAQAAGTLEDQVVVALQASEAPV